MTATASVVVRVGEPRRATSARYGGSTAVGLSAGAELHLPVGSRLAVVAGWRLFVPQLMALAVTVDGLAASDEGIEQLQWDDVQRTLAPAPVQWRPITSDVTVGFAVRF